MRLVLAGTPEVAVPSLAALVASRHDVVGVVTRPDAAAGRGRRSRPSPVRVLAESHGIPVLAPRHPRDPEFVAALTDLRPDCVPVVAYGALVPRAALDVPTHGWVNLHFSLLPAWRGAAPVQHAIMAGDDISGVTVFRLDEGMDTGPVLATMTERLRPDDTSGDVLDRLATAGAQLLVQVMDALEDGAVEPVPQPADGASLAPKIGVPDARVDLTLPAVAVDRLVRGCTPSPGAWTTLDGRRLKLGPVSPVGPGDERSDAPAEPLGPGQVRVAGADVLVGTATVPVRLSTVQPEGKRPMPAGDWARGARLTATSVLGEPEPTPAPRTDEDHHG
ncbi:methionyl-tRNA formyltransferase [Aquipuribacter sp. MA13-6]|uniref:methionyl-tRNA formyltransferase n=1 Tax=unclassified Aquipuribacter TaxID=2635084 RepID=UPI003EEE8C28